MRLKHRRAIQVQQLAEHGISVYRDREVDAPDDLESVEWSPAALGSLPSPPTPSPAYVTEREYQRLSASERYRRRHRQWWGLYAHGPWAEPNHTTAAQDGRTAFATSVLESVADFGTTAAAGGLTQVEIAAAFPRGKVQLTAEQRRTRARVVELFADHVRQAERGRGPVRRRRALAGWIGCDEKALRRAGL